jgi:23S rRNA (uracil1939-C5)-methyltransferase
MVTPGQILSLTVEKPAAGGRMIARIDGQIALVAGAIPGERVHARVERVTRGVVFMETTGVDEPSQDRREARADPLCGGCLFNHIAYPRQLEIKSQVIADAFARIAHLNLPGPVQVAESPEEGYRMRARLHVRGSRAGFYREGTHELCDPRATRQLLPATCDVLDRLAASMRSLAIDSVRELEVAENVDASERAVALIESAPLAARDPEKLARLARLAESEGITGIASSSGSHGTPYVSDRLTMPGGAPIVLRRHVASFFQGNRHLLSRFVTHVVNLVPPEGELLDLYAGVGLFSVCAASARGARVTAIEGDRIAAADLAANATSSGTAVTAVCQPVETFVSRDAAAVRSEPAAPLAAITDPPRTGMSPPALDGLIRIGAGRIVYVSCDVATLARDARKIVDAGYVLARADAFDLFPNTPHVETIVVFDR